MRVCMQRTFGKGLLPIAAVVFTMLSGLSATTPKSIATDRELWVYCPANFLVESECDRVHKILEQAARAGYTHALISDSKFSRLHEMDQRYFKHIAELKTKAAQLKLVWYPPAAPWAIQTISSLRIPTWLKLYPLSNRATQSKTASLSILPIQTLNCPLWQIERNGASSTNASWPQKMDSSQKHHLVATRVS